jgi:peptidoglycan/LPS O-acetylase OafA/YrhL
MPRNNLLTTVVEVPRLTPEENTLGLTNELGGRHWTPQRWIPSLDAIRGVAALAVVVHHASLQRFHIIRHAVFIPNQNVLFPVLFWMGSWGVTLFFVLSGFCIHLPQARRDLEQRPRPAWRGFYARRAFRILPTHYIALAFALIAAYLWPTDLVTRPTFGALAAHFLMIHTWISRLYFYSINAVFWSIAVEVHFYLVYPLLLWLRARIGAWFIGVLLGASLCTYLLASLLRSGDARFVAQNFFLVTWWQWGLGALLADVYVRGHIDGPARFLFFRGASVVWIIASLALAWTDPAIAGIHLRPWLFPPICAAVVLSLTTQNATSHALSFVARIGAFSYSLYLVHPIALAITARLLPSHSTQPLVGIFSDIVFSVALARGFFQLVERHFLNTPFSSQSADEIVEQGSTTPCVHS